MGLFLPEADNKWENRILVAFFGVFIVLYAGMMAIVLWHAW